MAACSAPWHFVHTNTWSADTLVVDAVCRCRSVETRVASATWCANKFSIVVETHDGCVACVAAGRAHLNKRVVNGERHSYFFEDVLTPPLTISIDRNSGGMRYAVGNLDATNERTAYSASIRGDAVSPALQPAPWSKSSTPSCAAVEAAGVSLK